MENQQQVKIKGRIVMTVLVWGLWAFGQYMIGATQPLVSGRLAGMQFDNSDLSYLGAQLGISAVGGLTAINTLLAILVLVAIWYRPVKALLAAALVIALLMPAAPARAYYDQTDYTEAYFILPNESAFFIPDVGANRTTQAAFGSEDYLRENKIAAKRFQIPHQKLPNSGAWSNYYVPTGRLIIVDRSPFNREWVAQMHRGTSAKDESFPCQSKEGLNISVGIAIGASVSEENVAKFLYRFGVKPPVGDRTKPEVIFASVFTGRSLTEVMDGPVRSKVQSLVCNEFTKRTFDEGNSQATAIMTAIETSVTAYAVNMGITLEYIGWADTFTFDSHVQDVINRRYVASQESQIAAAMAPHISTLQGLATAEATRTLAGKWDGKAPSTVSLWWLPSGIGDFLTRMVIPSK